MKKILLTMSLVLATIAVADELPAADQDLIDELKHFCTEVAEEDGTNGKELKVFLLECVNQELISEGYKPITKLD